MSERGILFSAPMVRAILAGTKTQTRRAVKNINPTLLAANPEPHHVANALRCPYGVPGERLWVREAWAPGDLMVFNAEKDDPETILYRADKAALHWDGKAMRTPMDTYAFNWGSVRWKPSIHMPRWASRITLEVTGVRVERLKDISRGDAMDEGCPFQNMAKGDDPRQWYAALWDQINGPGSWDANPWVWCVSFRAIQALDAGAKDASEAKGTG
jgi:hypothetical protein